MKALSRRSPAFMSAGSASIRTLSLPGHCLFERVCLDEFRGQIAGELLGASLVQMAAAINARQAIEGRRDEFHVQRLCQFLRLTQARLTVRNKRQNDVAADILQERTRIPDDLGCRVTVLIT